MLVCSLNYVHHMLPLPSCSCCVLVWIFKVREGGELVFCHRC